MCQVYIAKWSDTTIWLVPNIPVGVQDTYQSHYGLVTVLSPLNDFSPYTFPGVAGCPVVAGDGLKFTVVNPQTRVSFTTQTITVSSAGTTLF